MAATVTLTQAYDKLSPVVTSLESSLSTTIDSLSSSTSISQQKLLQIQAEIQQWSTAINLATSLQKEIADTLKGITQKL